MTFEEWWKGPREVPQTEHAEREAFQAGAASRDAEIAELLQQLAAKQAEVDALMLEYCQKEMSQEQLNNWAAHQQSRSFTDPVTDDDFLHMIDESNFAQERE